MRGRSCYTFGALLYVVSGGLHMIAHFQPPPPELAPVYEQMAKASHSVAGMTFTVEGATQCLSWYITTFSLLTGLVALALVRHLRDDAWLLRGLGTLLGLGAAMLAAFAFHYGIAPPAGLYAATAVLFLAAAARAKKPAAAV